MAVRLRLRREGTKKKPHFRVVAADKRSPRDGRFIEIIGEYHPAEEPSRIDIDNERALYWLRNGAQPSNTVEKLLRISGAWERFKPGDEPARVRAPRQDRPSKKARERAEEERAEEERAATDRAAAAATADAAPAEEEPASAGAPAGREGGDAHTGAAPPTEEVEAGAGSPEDATAAPAAETDTTADAAGGPGEGEQKEASQ